MRFIIAVALVALTFPAVAEERYSASDAYFACLVGKASVEINHRIGAVMAFEAALEACATERDLADEDYGGDMGSAAEAVEHAAESFVDAIGDWWF